MSNQWHRYGTESFGRLQRVMLHCPLESLSIINNGNYKYYLFDNVPDIEKYRAEHTAYKKLLEAYNVEVLELSDYIIKSIPLMNKLPSLPYLHDSSVITSKGALLSKMRFPGRQGEEKIVKEALANINIPLWHHFESDDEFEGCLLLSPDTIFIADTERHKPSSIEKFIPVALEFFKEVIYVKVPQERRFMHPDMIFNLINEHLALIYLPAFLHTYHITKNHRHEIPIRELMKEKEIELIELSDDEQCRWGSSIVQLEPNVFFNYDISLNDSTRYLLESKHVKIISLHPEALLAGGGSLRCLTLQLYRSPAIPN